MRRSLSNRGCALVNGQRAPIAAELFVHQQTVGYRVGQLKELFGESLDDPEARFELELVLRAGHR